MRLIDVPRVIPGIPVVWLACPLYREDFDFARSCEERLGKGVLQADEQLDIRENLREFQEGH